MTLTPGLARRDSAGRATGEDRPGLIDPISVATVSMGGRLVVHLDPVGRADDALHDSRRVIARIDRWAARLTRHTDTSDLARLNADPTSAVAIRPTLAAGLMAGIAAADDSEGLADITLLDARLAESRRSRPGARVTEPPCLTG